MPIAAAEKGKTRRRGDAETRRKRELVRGRQPLLWDQRKPMDETPDPIAGLVHLVQDLRAKHRQIEADRLQGVPPYDPILEAEHIVPA